MLLTKIENYKDCYTNIPSYPELERGLGFKQTKQWLTTAAYRDTNTEVYGLLHL